MSARFSNAFERLVNTNDPADDDLVGLLAYASYKRDKRDFALGGDKSAEELANHHKMLTSGVVEKYRENALRRLENYGEKIVEAASPQIEERTRTATITAAKNEIIATVRNSTTWWQSIILNVVAWLISLAITFLVAVGLGKVSLNIISGN